MGLALRRNTEKEREEIDISLTTRTNSNRTQQFVLIERTPRISTMFVYYKAYVSLRGRRREDGALCVCVVTTTKLPLFLREMNFPFLDMDKLVDSLIIRQFGKGIFAGTGKHRYYCSNIHNTHANEIFFSDVFCVIVSDRLTEYCLL